MVTKIITTQLRLIILINVIEIEKLNVSISIFTSMTTI